ncbi:hypothetical protein C9374_006161 [Naegleria lovaniensis]|uniref:U3 small nucleolar RNA-associated protein 20 N-terminal domain-containing protein n=1 Tax=Naegleria lovaniensis TaxID=51637 RepID=A0AA88GNW3_NAELO|nr:uncharacterized protein C9374_006161 [Naegleria lovaniensis]KAG2381777.1 hypothetical protein C9374_006161 [Naegleria lovaniensis]
MNLNLKNFPTLSTDIEGGLTIGAKIFEPPLVNRILNAFNNLYHHPVNSRISYNRRCFKIIDKLKAFFDESSPADIILNFYGSSIRDGTTLEEDEAHVLLHLFKKYLLYSSDQVKRTYIIYFSKMFINNSETIFRRSLCEIIEQLAHGFNSETLKFTSRIINGLNAQEDSHLTQMDTTSRVKVFNEILEHKSFITTQLGEIELYPIVGNLLFFLNHKEWILRDGACKALIHVLIDAIVMGRKRSTMITTTVALGTNSGTTNDGTNSGRNDGTTNSGTLGTTTTPTTTTTNLSEIVKTLLFYVKRGAFSSKLLDRNENMMVFAKLLDVMDELKDSKPFSQPLNLISDQNMNKKLQGVQSICSLITPLESCSIPQSCIYDIVAPLVYELMVISDKNIQEMIKGLAVYLVTRMDWNYSHPILNQFVTMMGGYGMKILSKRKKMALDIICQIVDVFPFEKMHQRDDEMMDESDDEFEKEDDDEFEKDNEQKKDELEKQDEQKKRKMMMHLKRMMKRNMTMVKTSMMIHSRVIHS